MSDEDLSNGNGIPSEPGRNPIGGTNPIGNGNGQPSPVAPRGGAVCGAKTRRGTPCQARPCANGRCAVHGGLTPSGIASPHFKHGKRSRYLKDLPHELRAGYKAALADPELPALGGELALLEVRIGELLRKLQDTAAPPWGQAVESLNDLAAAVHKGNLDAIREALARHSLVVRTGADAAKTQEATWRQLMGTIDLKAKTATAEARRMHDAEAFVRAGEVMTWVTALLDTVRKHVKDHMTLRLLQQDLLPLLPAPER